MFRLDLRLGRFATPIHAIQFVAMPPQRFGNGLLFRFERGNGLVEGSQIDLHAVRVHRFRLLDPRRECRSRSQFAQSLFQSLNVGLGLAPL